MPKTPEQFEAQRQEKKQLIMEAALKLFAEQGYQTTTISAIAQMAKISKGLVYNYFSSKEELLQAILLQGLNELMQFFDTNHDGVLTQEEFQYFLRESMQAMQDNFTFWKLYLSLVTQPQILKDNAAMLMDYMQPIFQMMDAYYLRKGVANPQAHTRIVGAILDGIGLHYVMDPDHFPLQESLDIIIEKFS